MGAMQTKEKTYSYLVSFCIVWMNEVNHTFGPDAHCQYDMQDSVEEAEMNITTIRAAILYFITFGWKLSSKLAYIPSTINPYILLAHLAEIGFGVCLLEKSTNFDKTIVF